MITSIATVHLQVMSTLRNFFTDQIINMEFIILLKPKTALTSMSSSSNSRRIKSIYNKPVNIRGFWLTYKNVTRSFNFVFYCLSLIHVWKFCFLIVDSMYFFESFAI